MNSTDHGIVIVGAGECGTRAACALRELGWTGRLTLVGAESVAPYERPPLSKQAMTSDTPPPPTTIRDADALRAVDIDFRTGVAATDIDRAGHQLVLADGHRIGYQRLLLATGANPRRLSLGGRAVDGIYYLRTHTDALALRERLWPGARIAVIGGGFIGLELAASAKVRGCAVTVVEMAPRLLSRIVPAPIADLVAQRHTRAGVDVRCGTAVAELTSQDGTTTVELTNGDTLECDTVIAGIGASPDTALAEKAGLAIDNGIHVDATLATSDPDIFAAGDCCAFPHPLYGNRRIRLEAWRNAQDQATAVAHNMLGAARAFSAVPWFWSDQFDLTLQIAGLPDQTNGEIVRHRPDGVDIRFGVGSDGRLLAASAIGQGNAVAKDIRLAEMLIATQTRVDPTALADPSRNLKNWLRAH
jgi:3-phenylpropionate/trans-cinnamate dioxygenase ferredoxin reductase subunit